MENAIQGPKIETVCRCIVLNDQQSLLDRCQDGRTLVLNEDDEKLRRLRFAGVATDNVNVIGTFIEGLTG
jgi:hypothetical protein